MWWWWVFIIHNCVSIFWFVAKNAKKRVSIDNKHVFWQYYFLHMWPTPKARHVEAIDCQMVFKMSPLPFSLFLRNSKIVKLFYDSIVHEVDQMNMYFHRKSHVFVVQKNWNQLCDFMHSFWLVKKKWSFDTWYIFKTQTNIYIVSKFFLNNYINLTRHHFVYWHTII
jgi:hypothetical protein